MNVLPAVTFPLVLKKRVFFPYGIIVTTPWASLPILFASEFFQMDLVGPLIRCLYSSDSSVVGSMTTFAWWCSWILFLVLQRPALLDPLLFPALCYCTGVLLAVDHICFLCSFHSSVVSLVPIIFDIYIFLVAADGVFSWIGLGIFCSIYLD